uniref:Uncharacterized protein n=1 Tax=Rhipicephalus zambeziensis TaxID=60191 RepID=A0A224YFP4_9ACAR
MLVLNEMVFQLSSGHEHCCITMSSPFLPKRLLLQLQCLQCRPACLSITVTKDSAFFLWTTLLMECFLVFRVGVKSGVYCTGLDDYDIFFCCPAVPAI